MQKKTIPASLTALLLGLTVVACDELPPRPYDDSAGGDDGGAGDDAAGDDAVDDGVAEDGGGTSGGTGGTGGTAGADDGAGTDSGGLETGDGGGTGDGGATDGGGDDQGKDHDEDKDDGKDDGKGDDGKDDGKGDGKGDDGGQEEPTPLVYVARLGAINDSGVTGHATFTIEQDRFTAVVDADGLAPDMLHPQHIHAGSSCPTPANDLNGDGYVDVIEAQADTGAILVPLDTDLAIQLAGDFPRADSTGSLHYMAAALLSDMLADLRAEDPDPEDGVAKLGEGEDLALERRVVELHGISPDIELPDTVASLPGLDDNVTLPVACAVIELRVRDADDDDGGSAVP